MKPIKAGKIFSYMALPGIIPRSRELFASGFGYTAFLMASIYNMVRLLPASHPYLNPQNIGKFGIRHVVAEAANNLVLSRKNIDQIIIFAALLAAIVILFVQVALLVYAFIVHPALADVGNNATGPLTSMFTTLYPKNDIALNLLDRVFGIPKFFCNPTDCTAYHESVGMSSGNVLPFHAALHELFRFYSMGMLFIAVLIFLYFVVVVVAETAVSGTPFGERFQNVWVPIRLVLALGLLLPVNYGINVGQYVALQAAKMGSGFASNGWIRYNLATLEAAEALPEKAADEVDAMQLAPAAKERMVSLPTTPDVKPMLEAISIAHACAYAIWHEAYPTAPEDYPNSGSTPEIKGNGFFYIRNPYTKIRPYLVKNKAPSWVADQREYVDIRAPKSAASAASTGTVSADPYVSYTEALDFYGNGDITIVFGIHGEGEPYENYPGNVEPTCGSIRIPIADTSSKGCGRPSNDPADEATISGIDCAGKRLGGADRIQAYYYYLIRQLWPTSNGFFTGEVIKGHASDLISFVQRFIAKEIKPTLDFKPETPEIDPIYCYIGCALTSFGNKEFGTGIVLPACGSGLWSSPDPSDINLKNPPCDTGEMISGQIRESLKEKYESDLSAEIAHAWIELSNSAFDANMMTKLQKFGWGGAGIWYSKIQDANGGFVSAVNGVPRLVAYPLIMQKVLEVKRGENAEVSNVDMFTPQLADGKPIDGQLLEHNYWGDPLQIASALNKFYIYWGADPTQTPSGSLMRDFIDLLFGTAGLSTMSDTKNAHIHPLAQLTALGKGLVDSAVFNVLGSFVGGVLGPSTSPFLGKAAGMLSNFAFLGLTAGFILFYVLPFMPFLFFFFAVGTWVKGIFEAMVGIPLWALAHLRIDGEGLPGSAGLNGYYLIFDIFIRPILVVFGLVASLIIFSAQVRILNFIWMLVIENVGGHELDQDPVFNVALKEFNISFRRDSIDQFFFTLFYAVIVYMLANASFKLIDDIPKQLLRWMGSSAQSYSDLNSENPSEISSYAAVSGMTFGQQITGAVSKAGGQLGAAFAGEMKGKGTGGQ